MGSFSSTCAVSSLPIEAGDKIKYFLLYEGPYKDDGVCYSTDLWAPRTWPINGSYNDYGGAENLNQASVQAAWHDAFKLDLLERGWGDNSVHDTEVRRRMKISELINAVAHGTRVKVSGCIHVSASAELESKYDVQSFYSEHKVPDNIPTIQSVESILLTGNIKAYTGDFQQNQLMIDEEGYGRVRVRASNFDGNLKLLNNCQKLLTDKYATMLTSGTGPYAGAIDLLVRPLPSVKDYHFLEASTGKQLTIQHCMIRQDVWDAICSLSIKPDYGESEPSTVSKFIKRAQRAWDRAVLFIDKKADLDVKLALCKDDNERNLTRLLYSSDELHYSHILSEEDFDLSFFVKDAHTWVLGLATSFMLVVKRRTNMSQSQIDEFIKTCGEFAFINTYLSTVRHLWHPTYHNGPQFGEWRVHQEYVNAISSVIRPYADEEAKQEQEDKAWEEKWRADEAKKAARKAAKKAAKKTVKKAGRAKGPNKVFKVKKTEKTKKHSKYK